LSQVGKQNSVTESDLVAYVTTKFALLAEKKESSFTGIKTQKLSPEFTIKEDNQMPLMEVY